MICAYSDSDDARRWGSKNKVVVLEESEHERNEDNIPKERILRRLQDRYHLTSSESIAQLQQVIQDMV